MIIPKDLSKDEVESLFDRAHPNGEGLDPNHAPDRRLLGYIRTWLRWNSTGRHSPPPYFACRAITAALNHREQGAHEAPAERGQVAMRAVTEFRRDRYKDADHG